MIELSVIIPSRNEEWLGHTVADVLAHSSERTEIIVVLDGEWPTEPLPQHPRVTVLYHPTSVGQRAATNEAARVSTAPWIMKLDAHCSVAPGFDTVLLDAAEQLGPTVTQIPSQKNLHVYSWRCPCGWEQYQGPAVTACPKCDKTPERVLVWQERRGTTTSSWVLDSELHFQYDKAGQRKQQGDICDVMTSLGACFFMRRDRFLGMGGLDEAHGSWGQFGAEIALKTWLSGGRHVVNKRTWFAHFFRVGGVGFPYPISGQAQESARTYSRTLWRDNAWPGQVKPLRWLVEKFTPAGWTPEQIAALPDGLAIQGGPFGGMVERTAEQIPAACAPAPSAGVLYYSDNRGDETMLRAVRRQLVHAASGLPIVAVTLPRYPVDNVFGAQGTVRIDGGPPDADTFAGMRHVVLPLERGYLAMARQILTGLQLLETNVVFFCEHDCLYPPDYFTFRPPADDAYYYAANTYKVCADTGRALTYQMEQLSGLCADRQLLLEHFRRRVAHIEQHGFTRRLGFEPGKPIRHGGLDDIPRKTWDNPTPIVDIRHSHNLTPSRWEKSSFRNQKYTEGWSEGDGVPGWGQTAGRFDAFLQETTRGV